MRDKPMAGQSLLLTLSLELVSLMAAMMPKRQIQTPPSERCFPRFRTAKLSEHPWLDPAIRRRQAMVCLLHEHTCLSLLGFVKHQVDMQ